MVFISQVRKAQLPLRFLQLADFASEN